MRNIDIHNEFDKAEVRNVIAKGLINTFEREASVYSYKPGTRLEQAEEKLRIAQNNVEAIKEQEAFITIMKSMGWEEFDVSDETSGPYGKYYLSFIGTEQEYQVLLTSIENEK